jgi:hypothetical protein
VNTLKSTCSKWHFDEVGQGSKKTTLGVFLLLIFVKKIMISCSVSLKDVFPYMKALSYLIIQNQNLILIVVETNIS